jgi:hypothetical protein
VQTDIDSPLKNTTRLDEAAPGLELGMPQEAAPLGPPPPATIIIHLDPRPHPSFYYSLHNPNFSPLPRSDNPYSQSDAMTVRQASHAGSWYSDDEVTLTRQLDRWLAQVPDEVEGLGKLPIPGARVIIAPYACLLQPVISGIGP